MDFVQRFERVLSGEVQGDVVCGDCLDVMERMPDGCVDLVIADPPYGLKRYCWDRYSEKFARKWIFEAVRLLNSRGAIYVMGYPWMHKYQGMILDTFTNLKFKNEIIWCYYKGRGRYNGFRPEHENIWLYVKSEYRHNVDAVRRPFQESTLQRWPQKDGRLIIQYPDSTYGTRWNVKRQETYPVDKGAIRGDWWKINQVCRGANPEYTKHPTQKPETLVEIMIKASSNQGNLILDPFIGSGTTAVVAKRLGRNFFGCDISEEYVKLSLDRISQDRLKRSQLSLEGV